MKWTKQKHSWRSDVGDYSAQRMGGMWNLYRGLLLLGKYYLLRSAKVAAEMAEKNRKAESGGRISAHAWLAHPDRVTKNLTAN